MILSARTISERLVESGCLPSGALENNQNRMTMMDCETRGRNVSRDDRNEPGRQLIITPFAPESLQPASYDLRASQDIVLPTGYLHTRTKPGMGGTPGRSCGDVRCDRHTAGAGSLFLPGLSTPGSGGSLPCVSSTWEMKISRLRRTTG